MTPPITISEEARETAELEIQNWFAGHKSLEEVKCSGVGLTILMGQYIQQVINTKDERIRNLEAQLLLDTGNIQRMQEAGEKNEERIKDLEEGLMRDTIEYSTLLSDARGLVETLIGIQNICEHYRSNQNRNPSIIIGDNATQAICAFKKKHPQT